MHYGEKRQEYKSTRHFILCSFSNRSLFSFLYYFLFRLSLVLSLSLFSAQLNFSSLIDIPFLPSESVVLSFHVYEYRHTHTKHIFYKFVFVCQSVRQALFFRFISSSRLLCRSVRTLLSLSVVHFT